MVSSKRKMDGVVSAVIEQMQDRYAKRGGKGLIMFAADKEEHGAVSTGSLALDLIMGGGVHYGRPVELFGEHSSGKSLVLMQILRETQRAGGEAILADVEGAYTSQYGTGLGLDNATLGYCAAKTVELLTEMLLDYIAGIRQRSVTTPIMLGVDSIASLTTQHRLDEPLDTADLSKAKMLYGMLAKLRAVLVWGPVGLVWINQTRERINTGWTPPGVAAAQKGRGKALTSGGKGPGFEAHTRIELTRQGAIYDGVSPKKRDEVDARVAVGEYIGAFAEKTRLTKPFGHCTLLHRFGSGLDRWHGLWDALVRTGRLTGKDDAWQVWHGRGEVLEFSRGDFEALVEEHPEILLG